MGLRTGEMGSNDMKKLKEETLELLDLVNAEIETLQEMGYKVGKIREETLEEMGHYHETDIIHDLIESISVTVSAQAFIKTGMSVEEAFKRGAMQPYVFQFMKEKKND